MPVKSLPDQTMYLLEDNMFGFKSFLRKDSRKYIAAQYNDATQERLRMWCYENGFDLSKKYDGTDQPATDFDFHTTIFYSTSTHVLNNGIFEVTPFSTYPTEFEYLGEDKNIPVLKVRGGALLEWRHHFESKYDMKDQWPDYKAHISLSYNKDQLPDMSKLKLPNFPLTVDKVKIRDVED